MIDVDFFLDQFKNDGKEQLVRFAKVDPNYTTGRPGLIFDGESIVSGKKYPYLSSYTPSPSDRVMLVKEVIQGKIL